ncbi:MAG: DUF6527 family protein [Nostoc sp.]|uniref:DUF6527 family protein n=1 Tax=Nostoc sp. TaxID=1180 RepID=UPI002FF4D26B
MFLRGVVRQLLIWLRFIRQPDLSARIVPTHPAPENIKPGEILVVGDAEYQKWACFRCPGGCGENILLSLNQKRHPCWAIAIDSLGRPTLQPSVRQLNECHCHFWVRQGIVEWCADSGQE